MVVNNNLYHHFSLSNKGLTPPPPASLLAPTRGCKTLVMQHIERTDQRCPPPGPEASRTTRLHHGSCSETAHLDVRSDGDKPGKKGKGSRESESLGFKKDTRTDSQSSPQLWATPGNNFKKITGYRLYKTQGMNSFSSTIQDKEEHR
ncbi:hypothetical protein CgunFtcFv8_016331 [Champsocephalus gunnari]|uniref:Uncharacterized protein n=1 Tax=Champsocephalus gunnari TaxID=52237 RepID=A0AAN8HAS0_CHAGU|nr:hypothetical protein CgunFtcFv8_016331 [Champsocephalus gunnari]